MDDLYGNLDNYNDENTISELKTENKELKCKLEEYATTISDLQKEFDKLSKEYKKLEFNYSSLLKTAKAEIERKTQIITNLNIEKDKMVLQCYQNRNGGSNRFRERGSPKLLPKIKVDTEKKPDKVDKQFQGNKERSPYPAIDRREDPLPARVTTTSPHLRSRLLGLSNTIPNQQDRTTEKNSDVKENVIQQIKQTDSSKARASIKNRRKSMPVLSADMEQFSDDEDYTVSSKERAAQHSSEKRKDSDYNTHERPKSRISETSSLDERKSGYQEPKPESHKQRYSRYDRDSNDRHRVRHKSSHRYKRLSPDRHHGGSREFHDSHYHRSEPERYKPKGRVLESPPKNIVLQRQSRDKHSKSYNRSHCLEQERLSHRSQERYSTKRRNENALEELQSKKARMETQSGHFEDQRIQDDILLMDKRYMTDPLNIQFSSCESPDYDNLESPNQQIKEIKLTATTDLDDPRMSSKKYVLKNNENKMVLSTVIGRNVDIIPITRDSWNLESVTMPEALIKKPSSEPDHSSATWTMEIENSANISLESGEIQDQDGLDQNNRLELKRIPASERKVSVPKVDEFGNIEKSLEKINSYKIPKLKKTAVDNINTKETSSTNKQSYNTVPCTSTNISKNSDAIKSIDENKQLLELHKGKESQEQQEQKQKEKLVTQTKSQLPFLDTGDVYDQKTTSNKVVEGDLEMSDDNCDDNKEQSNKVIKEHISTEELEKIEIYNQINNTKETNISGNVILEPQKNKTPASDGKKSKSKKKSKHREHKEATKNDDTSKAKKKDKVIDNRVNKNDDSTKTIEKSDNRKDNINEIGDIVTGNEDSIYEKPVLKTKKLNVLGIKENETMVSSKIIENPATKTKIIESKTKHIKTKFSELFDDSSSLISPEDLGLLAVPTSTTQLPFFEDAVDVTDLNAMKPVTANDKIPSEKSGDKENKVVSDDAIMAICDPMTQESQVATIDKGPITDEDIQSIYKNLEPGQPEQENDVQTVVISTGVQPTMLVEPDLQLKTSSQFVALKALATSTPQKISSEMTPVVIDPNVASCSNDIPVASVDSTAMADKSDTNTMDSLTNDTSVPDVRIFVKRRRKVVKK